MGGKNSISLRDLKILWGQSGNLCAICKTPLVESNENGAGFFVVGQAAHIEGEKPNSARYNSSMISVARNSHKNLILLCPTDHAKIDKDVEYYSVQKLHEIKKDHENWVRENLKANIPNITFIELEIVLRYISSADVSVIEDLSLVHPEEKVKKNKLSPEVDRLIRMGISQAGLVKDYFNRNIDIHFSDKIKSKFVEKYELLKATSLDGDAIFYNLLDFTSGNNRDIKIRTAALCVVAYFFERCDVFEK